MQHWCEMCLDVGLMEMLWCYSAVGCPKEAFLQVSFLFHSVGFYNCWAVHEIKLFFLSFPRQYPKRISESKSSLHYILFFARQSGHNSALDFTGGNEITLNRNGFSGGWNSNCRFFLLLEKRQVSNHPKFPLNGSPAAVECQLGIEPPRETTRNTNTLCCALWGVFLQDNQTQVRRNP